MLRARPGRRASGPIVPLVEAVAERVARVRLLYLYPSDLTDPLIDAICATGVPYFDLSLQHVSRAAAAPHAALGRRRPVPRAASTTSARREPDAAFRSNFIVGYPGETEADHDAAARASSRRRSSTGAASSPSRAEDGTYAAGLDGVVDRRR